MWPDGQKIHMVGIGGAGMSSMALFLKQGGASLSGSDMGCENLLKELREKGMDIPQAGSLCTPMPKGLDLLIHTAAVDDMHPEVKVAIESGVEVIKYSTMLGRIMSLFKGIAVAGTHGKTSVAALCAFLLKESGVSPSYIVGGYISDLGGGGGWGDGDLFIAEACEFDRSFLKLDPHWAMLTNIEPDHLDYYGNFENLKVAFSEFVSKAAHLKGHLIIWDEAAKYIRPNRFSELTTFTYGFNEESNLVLSDYCCSQGAAVFNLHLDGKNLGEFISPTPGRHNALNAAAATLLSIKMGVEPQAVKKALEVYKGVRRRLELKGVWGGVRVFSDYAHHPTEIKGVLESLRAAYPDNRLVAAYQGHQNWRTAYFFKEFGEVLSGFDLTMVLDTYSVRESGANDFPDGLALADIIAKNNGRSQFVGGLDEAPHAITPYLKNGDILVLMGAGTIDEISNVIEGNLSLRGKRFVEKENHSGDRGQGASLL